MQNSKVFLRPIQLEDALLVLDWENNEEDWSSSNNDSPYQLYDIVQLIEELQDVQQAHQARWMICELISNSPIGAIDLCEIDFDEKTATVGVLVADKKHRKLGVGSESLDLIQFEALELGLNRLCCIIHPANLASVKLFTKAGFTKNGKSKDKYLSHGEYIEADLYEKWLNA